MQHCKDVDLSRRNRVETLEQLRQLVAWAEVEAKNPSMAIDVDDLAYWTHEAQAILELPHLARTGMFLRDLDECVAELTRIRRLSI